MNTLLKNNHMKWVLLTVLSGFFSEICFVVHSQEALPHQNLIAVKEVSDFKVSPDGAIMAHLALMKVFLTCGLAVREDDISNW